jgi:hypothetical protein
MPIVPKVRRFLMKKIRKVLTFNEASYDEFLTSTMKDEGSDSRLGRLSSNNWPPSTIR